MKNVLNYYYNINVENISHSERIYKFYIKEKSYIFINTDRSKEELTEIYNICCELYQLNIPIHEIILNKNNDIITLYDNKKYILLKKQKNSNELIVLSDIINFSNATKRDWKYKYINRTSWDILWGKKVDYFEYLISQMGQKNKILGQMFGYYEGIIENNIQLFALYNSKNEKYSICHKRIEIGMTTEEFYNPLNFIIDYSIRDVAEYLKSKMIINIDIYDEIKYCLIFNDYTNYEKKLLFIRIFFPSKQLDILEKNFLQQKDEKLIYYLLNSNFFYQDSIKKICTLFNAHIPKIDWLN